MEVKLLKYRDIPIYYAAKRENLPIVVVLHGFTSNHMRQEERTGIISKLYENEFCVVTFDSVNHGTRDGAEELLAKEGIEQEKQLFEIVEKSAVELDEILKFIKKSKIGKCDRIGITGISMGGFIIFRAIGLTNEISAAVPMVASPYFHKFAEERLKKIDEINFENYKTDIEELKKIEPFNNKENYINKKIYIMTGEYDETVPEKFGRMGYEELKTMFDEKKIGGNIKYSSYQAGHCDNEEMIKDMIEWFKETL